LKVLEGLAMLSRLSSILPKGFAERPRFVARRVTQFMFQFALVSGLALIAPLPLAHAGGQTVLQPMTAEQALQAQHDGQAIKAIYVLPDSRLLVVGETALAQDAGAVYAALKAYVQAHGRVRGGVPVGVTAGVTAVAHDARESAPSVTSEVAGIPGPRQAAQFKARGVGSAEGFNRLFAPQFARELAREMAREVARERDGGNVRASITHMHSEARVGK
jgi:hypothetical protein